MRVHLKGVHAIRKRLASGETVQYYYAWRGGPRLRGAPGTPEFLASFNEAHASKRAPNPGQLFSIISEFKSSQDFLALATKTRTDYSRYISLIEGEFGDLPLKALDDTRVRGEFLKWRDSMASHPRKADFAWTVLARIIAFGKNRGRIRTNPCERGGRIYRGNRRDKIWTDDQVQLALDKLPDRLRWAFQLAIWTGQRQGDLLRLSWSAYDGTHIRLVQSKTGKRLTVPVSSMLKRELDAIPRICPTILTNTGCRPWTPDGFRASWNSALSAMGISGVTFHDLRGSAVTRLAEAGATHAEIVAITGHSHDDAGSMMDHHYLSPTNALAERGIRRLERKMKTGTKTVNRP